MFSIEEWFTELQEAGCVPASLVYSGDDSYVRAWGECYRLRKLHTDLCFKVSVRSTDGGGVARLVYSYPKEE